MTRKHEKTTLRHWFVKRQHSRTAPFRWFGGKTKMMSRLLRLFPDHRRYISVFGGAGCDIFGKPRSRVEVYNDLNATLHNFYAVLRDDDLRKRLCWLLDHTPAGADQFAECLAVIQGDGAEKLKRAWAFYMAAQFSYGGLDPTRATKGNFSPSKDSSLPRAWLDPTSHIERIAHRFHSVILENRPWQEVVAKYDDKDTLFYLDPPYLPDARKSITDYACEMTEKEHIELLTCIRDVQGYVMLSGYPSELYAAHLKGWRTKEWSVITTVPKTRGERTEKVWMNYDSAFLRLAV